MLIMPNDSLWMLLNEGGKREDKKFYPNHMFMCEGMKMSLMRENF
jgi:hypothetical protein